MIEHTAPRAARRTPLVSDERGAELVEVLAVVALFALAGIAGIRALAGSVRSTFAAETTHLRSLTHFVASSVNPELGAAIGPIGTGVLTVDFDPQHPPGNYQAKLTDPNGLAYNVKVSASTGSALGPNGANTVTLQIDRTATGELSSKGSRGATTANLGAFAGENLNYRITIPEQAYQDMLAGRRPFVDPGDLSTLPDGASVLLREEDFRGSSSSLTYGIFTASGSNTDSQGNAVGLEIHGDEVRVLAGPTEAVSASTGLSFGKKLGPKKFQVGLDVALGGSQSLRDYQLEFADISKATGQRAYESFIYSGDVPANTAIGVADGGIVQRLEYDASSNISASIAAGPLKLTKTILDGRSISARRSEVQYNDGRREITGIASEGGVSVFENSELMGEQVTERQTGLLLDGVHPSYGALLGQAFGTQTQNRSYDMQLEFTQPQYTALRTRAIDMLAQGGSYDEATVRSWRAGPDAQGRLPADFVPPSGLLASTLVRNAHVDDFLTDNALQSRGPNTLAEDLASLYASDPTRPLPGTVHFYGDR